MWLGVWSWCLAMATLAMRCEPLQRDIRGVQGAALGPWCLRNREPIMTTRGAVMDASIPLVPMGNARHMPLVSLKPRSKIL